MAAQVNAKEPLANVPNKSSSHGFTLVGWFKKEWYEANFQRGGKQYHIHTPCGTGIFLEGALRGEGPLWWVPWCLYTGWLVKVKYEAILKGLWAKFAGKSFMSFPRHWVPQYLRLSVPSAAPTPSIVLENVQIRPLQKTSLPMLVAQSSRIWKRTSPKQLPGNQMLSILKKNPLPFRFWENKK